MNWWVRRREEICWVLLIECFGVFECHVRFSKCNGRGWVMATHCRLEFVDSEISDSCRSFSWGFVCKLRVDCVFFCRF